MNLAKPVILSADAYKKEIREVFALTDPKYELMISVRRDISLRICTCSVTVQFVSKTADSSAPGVRMFVFWFESDREIYVSLMGLHTGCRLVIGDLEVDQLASSERDRLHALLGELRGVNYTYIQDTFGFLKKDGSEKKQLFPLPFPQIAAEPDCVVDAEQ